ncbi:acyl-CoA dehydrogenase family protein [Streptomyces sp. BI20]|uniref:acyl-CoA dehydrogenase family protein n=1 Tax=Streptomyces sp. BI20 TaxID=3403460 RepID=UPI003C76921D
MDFRPTEEQTEAVRLAARILGDLSDHTRLDAAGGGVDAELWKALADAGLIAAVLDEPGAPGLGLLGLVLLLEEQGRVTAQVPYAATCAWGLLPIAAHGSARQRAELLPALAAGELVATGAFPARPGLVSAAGRLTGTAPVVPWLRGADLVLVPDADRALWLVRTDDPGVRVTPVETTAPWAAGRLDLDGAAGTRLGPPGDPEPYERTLDAARIAFAGLQAGVCAGSLARAVAHTSTREQFGRPLSTHQGVQLRAADAHMDTEAIRVTAYEAAWRVDQGLPAHAEALTAAWWAAEAGRRVVHTGQHLHGGTGADLDHPVHRHFLWGRQIDALLGGGARLLAELGEHLTEGPAAAAPTAPEGRS